MKYTKIVCTIGPATEKKVMIAKLIKAGMNVARLNFSHGDYKHHKILINNIRSAAKEQKQPIAIMQDLQGPRIRVGKMPESGLEIKKGESVVMVPDNQAILDSKIKVITNQYHALAADVKVGHHILIADGVIDLKIEKILQEKIYCRVMVGGLVKSHKGINVPGASIKATPVTSKDKRDVAFGLKQKVDFVALSFVRNKKDILALKKVIDQHSGPRPGIIAKIERPEAVKNFDEILSVVDGIMIARGDLGIEVEPQKVPIIQKRLIKKCLLAAKPVIVATQMLESMIQNNRPTRAEVSDVANAVIDHTDAVMLSGESASGQYPLEAVQMMSNTIKETEASLYDDYFCANLSKELSISEMIAHAVATICLSKKIKLIIVKEADLELVRQISAHRPECRIIVRAKDSNFAQRLNLTRGVSAYNISSDEILFIKKNKLAKTGDRLLVIEKDEIEFVDI